MANDLSQEVLRVQQTLSFQDWVPLKATADELEQSVRQPTAEMIAWAEGVLARPMDAFAAHRLEIPHAGRTSDHRRIRLLKMA